MELVKTNVRFSQCSWAKRGLRKSEASLVFADMDDRDVKRTQELFSLAVLCCMLRCSGTETLAFIPYWLRSSVYIVVSSTQTRSKDNRVLESQQQNHREILLALSRYTEWKQGGARGVTAYGSRSAHASTLLGHR